MLSRAAFSSLGRVGLRRAGGQAKKQARDVSGLLQGYGDNVFKGSIAEQYLSKQGLPPGTLLTSDWMMDTETADKVAGAVLEWATENDATNFTHVFQPLGASGVRHGLAGSVHNNFWKFDSDGSPIWDLKGKDLLKGETDGSSYPNGGLRGTHRAGGYLLCDPTSPIYLRGDTIFIPSCFVSYYGDALDEKTPLLRSVDAINEQGTRLLKLLGYEVSGITTNIGLEQEFFLVPRDAFLKRPDLMLAGRTILGADAPRGQEMCDHYMGALSHSTPALECLQAAQRECYKLGIPLRTRHREVAPNQYEVAPFFGTATTQIDQNVVVMQIIEETAAQFGLAALFQEKPFNNVNGSGKHNNWSIGTKDGVNLLNVKQIAQASGSTDIFPIVMAAIVSAVDLHGDLMRMAIASPGNDFRLGACEAPPAIVSTYLGDDMTSYLSGFANGSDAPYVPSTKQLDMGVKAMPPLEVPAEDRNRTSPFPYGGHRFEFRAVGSAQNVSMVNTVLNSITADAFKRVADKIEAGEAPKTVAQALLKTHLPKVVFNGDNYDESNQAMLTDRGVWRIDSGVDAICRFTDPKNVTLFETLNVLSADECASRQTIKLEHYAGTVEIEAKCFIDMVTQHVIPSCKAAGLPYDDLDAAVATIESKLSEIHAEEDAIAKANLSRALRLETMVDLRDVVDAKEKKCPANLWTLATYTELLFLDQTNAGSVPASEEDLDY